MSNVRAVLVPAASYQDRQVSPIVRRRVPKVRSEEHRRVIQQRAACFLDRGELAEKLVERLELGDLNQLQFLDLHRILAVVRQVMPIGSYTLDVAGHRVQASQIERDDSCRIRLERERHHVVHQTLPSKNVVRIIDVFGLLLIDFGLGPTDPIFVLLDPSFQIANRTQVLI